MKRIIKYYVKQNIRAGARRAAGGDLMMLSAGSEDQESSCEMWMTNSSRSIV